MYKNKYKIQKNNYIKYIIGGKTESELSYKVIRVKIQDSLNKINYKNDFLKFEKSEIRLGSSVMDFIGQVKQFVNVTKYEQCNKNVNDKKYKCKLNIELFNENIEDYSFLIYKLILQTQSTQINDEHINSINNKKIIKEVNGILLYKRIKSSKYNPDIIYTNIHFFGTIYELDQSDNSNELQGIIFEIYEYSIFIGSAKYVDNDNKIKYISGTKYEFTDNTFTKYDKVTFGHWENNNFDEYCDFDNDNQYQTYIKKINGKEVFTIKSTKNETTDKTTNEENIKEKLIVQNLYHYYEVVKDKNVSLYNVYPSSYKLYNDKLKEIIKDEKKLEFENSTEKKTLTTSIIQYKFVDIFSLVTI